MSNRLMLARMVNINLSTHEVAPVNQLPWYFHQKVEIPFIFYSINNCVREITWNEHLVCDYPALKHDGD